MPFWTRDHTIEADTALKRVAARESLQEIKRLIALIDVEVQRVDRIVQDTDEDKDYR